MRWRESSMIPTRRAIRIPALCCETTLRLRDKCTQVVQEGEKRRVRGDAHFESFGSMRSRLTGNFIRLLLLSLFT